MSTISELIVKIGADNSGLNKGLQESKQAINSTFSDVSPIKATEGALSSVGDSVTGLIGKFTGLVALAAGGFGLTSIIQSAVDAGAAVQTLADTMGISAGEAGQLSRVVKLAGGDVETVSKSMMRLDKSLQSSGDDGKLCRDTLSAVGVSLTNAHGKLLPINQQLSNLAKGFQVAKEAGQQQQYVMNTLGVRGMALIPVLNDMAAAQEKAAAIKSIGMDPAEMKRMQMNMRALELQSGQLKVALGSVFAELFGGNINKITAQMSGVAQTFRENRTEIKAITGDIAKLIVAYTAYKAIRTGVSAAGKIATSIQNYANPKQQAQEAVLTAQQERSIARRERAIDAAARREEARYYKTVQAMKVSEAEKTQIYEKYLIERERASMAAQARERAILTNIYTGKGAAVSGTGATAGESAANNALAASKAKVQAAENAETVANRTNSAAHKESTVSTRAETVANTVETASTTRSTVQRGINTVAVTASSTAKRVAAVASRGLAAAETMAATAAKGLTMALAKNPLTIAAVVVSTLAGEYIINALSADSAADSTENFSASLDSMTASAQQAIQTANDNEASALDLAEQYNELSDAVNSNTLSEEERIQKTQEMGEIEQQVAGIMGDDAVQFDENGHMNMQTIKDKAEVARQAALAELTDEKNKLEGQKADIIAHQAAAQAYVNGTNTRIDAMRTEGTVIRTLRAMYVDLYTVIGNTMIWAADKLQTLRDDGMKFVFGQEAVFGSDSPASKAPSFLANLGQGFINSIKIKGQDILANINVTPVLDGVSNGVEQMHDAIFGGPDYGNLDTVNAQLGEVNAKIASLGSQKKINIPSSEEKAGKGKAGKGEAGKTGSEPKAEEDKTVTYDIPIGQAIAQHAQNDYSEGDTWMGTVTDNAMKQCDSWMADLYHKVGLFTADNIVNDDQFRNSGAYHSASDGYEPQAGDEAYWRPNGGYHYGVYLGNGMYRARNSKGGVKTFSAQEAQDMFGDVVGWGSISEAAKSQGVAQTVQSSTTGNAETTKAAKEQADAAKQMTQILGEMLGQMNERDAGPAVKAENKALQGIATERQKIQKLADSGLITQEQIKNLNIVFGAYQKSQLAEAAKAWRDELEKWGEEYGKDVGTAYADYEGQAIAQFNAQIEKINQDIDKMKKDIPQNATNDEYVDAQTKINQLNDEQIKIAKRQLAAAQHEAIENRLKNISEYGDGKSKTNVGAVIDELNNIRSARSREQYLEVEDQKKLAQEYVKIWDAAHGTIANNIGEISTALYGSLADSIQEFVKGTKGAMSIVHSFGNTILSELTRIAANRLAGQFLSGILDSQFGAGKTAGYSTGMSTENLTIEGMSASSLTSYIPHFANGGIVTAPTVGLIGEAGYKEAVVPLTDGNLKSMGGGNAGKVVVNITNNSDSKPRVAGSRYDSGLNAMILDVVIDGATRNVGGFGTNMKQALK